MDRPSDYHDFYDDFQEEGTRITPGRLRNQINKLLETTDIKIGEFQRMIGVNANSWGKFMHGKYKDPWSATQNGTFWAAAYFFYREAKLGKQAMGKTRAYGATATATTARSSSTAATATAATPAGGPGATPGKKPSLPDVSAVSTDGTVFQTPGEVRKELRNVLQKYDASVASLARVASSPYQSFNNFMKATGEFGGRDNQSYHPAAMLVEKLRLASGKEKSKKRKALEAEMDSGVVDRRTGGPRLGLDPTKKYLMSAASPLYMTKDDLGRNVFASM